MANELHFIGQIRTPYKDLASCPFNIQPDGPDCQIVLDPNYQQGLIGLQPGQTILVLYWFENTRSTQMLQVVNEAEDDHMVGTFALRSPHRPNPIAVAMVEIQTITNGQIIVRGMDCLDGTKLLDIKPAI
ncbi:SAM-dependent methyltransferase [Magnetococcus sp. PR-3]|uniref:SAM-dependent methyltransferase n=1 Tax=Magnetococcus sp. PR-3 TaxID=3120355 RepID=UPI002FCDECB2